MCFSDEEGVGKDIGCLSAFPMGKEFGKKLDWN
jgi:hypothetical protein